MAARPAIIRNPADDAAFEAAIDDLLDAGLLDPAAVQEGLRARYPRAVVRRRELAGETAAVWYVYRDGRWTAGG